jgi:hypothetical protein
MRCVILWPNPSARIWRSSSATWRARLLRMRTSRGYGDPRRRHGRGARHHCRDRLGPPPVRRVPYALSFCGSGRSAGNMLPPSRRLASSPSRSGISCTRRKATPGRVPRFVSLRSTSCSKPRATRQEPLKKVQGVLHLASELRIGDCCLRSVVRNERHAPTQAVPLPSRAQERNIRRSQI